MHKYEMGSQKKTSRKIIYEMFKSWTIDFEKKLNSKAIHGINYSLHVGFPTSDCQFSCDLNMFTSFVSIYDLFLALD